MDLLPTAPDVPDGNHRLYSGDNIRVLCSKMEQCLSPNFAQKDVSELQYILSKEEEMLELQMRAPKTINMNQNIQTLIDHTKEAASYNLRMEGTLSERGAQLLSSVKSIEKLSREVSELQEKLQSAIESCGPESQYYNLQVAVLQADEECEKLNRDMFSGGGGNQRKKGEQEESGGMSVEQFIEKYREKRRIYHLRRAKQQQFERLMREDLTATRNNNTLNSTAHNNNSS